MDWLGIGYGRQSLEQWPTTCGSKVRSSTAIRASASVVDIEDRWISDFVKENEHGMGEKALESLRSSCTAALKTARVPTTRNEEYRFTDVSELTKNPVYVPDAPLRDSVDLLVSSSELDRDCITVVVVNGRVADVDISKAQLPEGAYVGNVKEAPQDVLKFSLGSQSRTRGGPFATLNGAVASDCVVVYVPESCRMEAPIHILNISSGGKVPGKYAVTAPRVLIFLESEAEAEVVEEYVTTEDTEDGANASFSVTEIELDDKAKLSHKYICLEDRKAVNFKSTLVSQGAESEYSLVEADIGGSLTRHDLGIVQLGKSTKTEMKHFVLSGEAQLHDLHSKLILDHPEGTADQLHKCIAASPTARGVFDGNVRVNRMAQKTDAQQLSRNLLLVPKATVNVKPNLQIVADDVKCTHGCAVSDLEEDQLFYLQARGIDTDAARKMLVYSFGGEILQALHDKKLIARCEELTTQSLDAIFRSKS